MRKRIRENPLGRNDYQNSNVNRSPDYFRYQQMRLPCKSQINETLFA